MHCFYVVRSQMIMLFFSCVGMINIFSILILPKFLLLKIGLIIATLILSFRLIRQHGFLSAPMSVNEFCWLQEKTWKLYFANGSSVITKIQGDSIVTRQFLLLRFKSQNNHKKFVILLFPDQLKTLRAECARKVILSVKYT